MWDMITLYDTKKKKMEDQQAYLQHKVQQKQLKKFYEEQMTYKKELQQAEKQQRIDDVNTYKKHHGQLNRYESNPETKQMTTMKTQPTTLQVNLNASKEKYNIYENAGKNFS